MNAQEPQNELVFSQFVPIPSHNSLTLSCNYEITAQDCQTSVNQLLYTLQNCNRTAFINKHFDFCSQKPDLHSLWCLLIKVYSGTFDYIPDPG